MTMVPSVDGKLEFPCPSNGPLMRCFSSSATPVDNAKRSKPSKAKRSKPSNVKRSKPSNVKRAKPRCVLPHSLGKQRLYCLPFLAKNPETRRLIRVILTTLGPRRPHTLPFAPDVDSYAVPDNVLFTNFLRR